MRLVLGLVLALSAAGCSGALVAAEGAIHRSIAVTQDTANAVCDAKLKSAEACREFNVKLIPVIVSAKSFNRAVREDSAAEVPAMLAALVGLRDAAVTFFPADMVAAIRARLESAYSVVAGMGRSR
jgi:MinD superfamily P-loop ATPase